MARAPYSSLYVDENSTHRRYVIGGPLPIWFFPILAVLLGVFIGQVNMAALLVAYGHRELNTAFRFLVAVSAAYFLFAALALYLTRVARLPCAPPPRYAPGHGRFQYLVAADRVDRFLLPLSLVCQGWSASMAAAHFSGTEWRATGMALVYVGQLLALPGTVWHILSLRWERLREVCHV